MSNATHISLYYALFFCRLNKARKTDSWRTTSKHTWAQLFDLRFNFTTAKPLLLAPRGRTLVTSPKSICILQMLFVKFANPLFGTMLTFSNEILSKIDTLSSLLRSTQTFGRSCTSILFNVVCGASFCFLK